MRSLLICLVTIAGVACGGSSDTAPTPPAPTKVQIMSASISRHLASNVGPAVYIDSVFVHLHNSGGAGSYYLEFWGLPFLGYGGAAQSLGQSSPVTVTAGYDETFVVTSSGAGLVYGFKVKSVPLNTAVATQTDCYQQAVENGICP